MKRARQGCFYFRALMRQKRKSKARKYKAKLRSSELFILVPTTLQMAESNLPFRQAKMLVKRIFDFKAITIYI